MTEYVVTLRIAGNSTGAKDALKVVDTELKQVQGQLKETEAQSQKTAAGFSKAGVALGTAIAATAVAMTTLIAKSITMADETGKTAARFGTSAEALSGWRAAAEMAGASSTALDAGLKGLSTSITAAAGGQKKFSQVFEDMGIAVKDASGEVRDLESLLPEIASKFQEYKNGPVEAALATKIFGAAGIELLPFLNEGAAGIDQLRERAEELGMVLSTKTTQEAAAFKDNLGELKMAGIGLFNSIAKDVLPILRDLSAMFVDQAVNALDGAKKTSYIADALKLVAGAAIIAKNALEMLANIMSGVLTAANTKVKSGFESVKDLTSGVLESMVMLGKGEGKQAIEAWRGGMVLAAKTAQQGSVDTQKALDEMRLNLTNNMEDMAKAFSLGANPALDEFKKKIEGTEPPVVDYTRNAKEATTATMALSASLRGMPTAEVADFEQTLVPFMLDVQEGSDAAGESYVEFADTVGYQSNIVGDAIGQMIDAAIYDWDNMGDAMIDIARNFLSQIARMFLSQNFQLNAGMGMSGGGYGSLLGGGGGGGGMGWGGYGGGAGGMGGAAGWFTGTANAAGVGLGTAALSILGPAALLYAGATQGPGWGAAAGAGAGLLFGSTAFGAAALGSTGLAAGAAALTGAQLGSVVPVIGTIIGAVVGLLAGYFMQEDDPRVDVIGSNVIGTEGNRNPRRTFNTALGEVAFSSVDSMDSGGLDALQKAITDFDAVIAGLLLPDQLATVSAALADFDETFKKDGITPAAILEERFKVILGTFSEDIQQFVMAGETLQDQVKLLAKRLGLDQLNILLDAMTEENRLAGMTELERQTEAINAQFDALVTTANNLEAGQETLTRIEELRADALERLTQAQRAQLDDLLDPLRFDDLTEGMTATEREIARINKSFDDMVARAIELGATEEDLALIERRRIAAINDMNDALEEQVEVLATLPDIYQPMEQFPDAMDDWRRAMQQVQDFLTGERYGSTSTLTPEQMLQAAQGDFAALLFRAQSGDANAAGGLAAAAQRLLELGRGYYASGDEYDALRNSVLGSLSPFGNLANNPSSQLHDAMNALRTAFVQFGQYLQEWNNRNNPPGSAANGANYAGGDSAMVVELRMLREEVRGVKAAVSAQGDKQASAIREGLKRGVG